MTLKNKTVICNNKLMNYKNNWMQKSMKYNTFTNIKSIKTMIKDTMTCKTLENKTYNYKKKINPAIK
jgi:hypothetical protein